MSNHISDKSGYLFRIYKTDTKENKAYIFLFTGDFEPVGKISSILTDMGEEVSRIALERSLAYEENSGDWASNSFTAEDEKTPGLADDLRNYTFADGTADLVRLRRHLSLLLDGNQVHPIKPVMGVVARAKESLIGRQKAREGLVAAVSKNALMLLGPRRSGKTSLLMWLVDEPPQGRASIYLNLETMLDVPNFVVALTISFLTNPQVKERLILSKLEAKGMPPIIGTDPKAWKKKFYGNMKGAWREYLASFFPMIGKGPSTLLILDEFGDFLSAIEDSDDEIPFLEITKRELADPERCCTIITGSKSLEHLIQTRSLAVYFGSYQRYPLPSFEKDDAIELFSELLRCRGFRPSTQAVEKGIDLVGHQIPFHIQMLAAEVRNGVETGDLSDPTEIEEAYQQALLGHPGQAYFNDLELKLKSFNQFHRRRAGQQILGFISERGEVYKDDLAYRFTEIAGGEKIFHELLVLLEEYFFIECREDRWRFRSPMMQDYARRYYAPFSKTEIGE